MAELRRKDDSMTNHLPKGSEVVGGTSIEWFRRELLAAEKKLQELQYEYAFDVDVPMAELREMVERAEGRAVEAEGVLEKLRSRDAADYLAQRLFRFWAREKSDWPRWTDQTETVRDEWRALAGDTIAELLDPLTSGPRDLMEETR